MDGDVRSVPAFRWLPGKHKLLPMQAALIEDNDPWDRAALSSQGILEKRRSFRGVPLYKR